MTDMYCHFTETSCGVVNMRCSTQQVQVCLRCRFTQLPVIVLNGDTKEHTHTQVAPWSWHLCFILCSRALTE